MINLIYAVLTRCRHILKTVKDATVAKFELAFVRCRDNLKMIGNSTVKNFLQDFDAKEMYLHSKNRSVAFQKLRKMFCFHHFRVFTRCCFQNVLVIVPFSKSTTFKICWQKMCRFHLNGRPIRHIFHRFQNVPASCERCLSFEIDILWSLHPCYNILKVMHIENEFYFRL